MKKDYLRESINQLIRKSNNKILLVALVLLTFFLIFKGMTVTGWGHDANYRNVSVRTTVNVTNSYPEITNITCNSGASITLTAGGTKSVLCLVQIRDYNGGNTINYVNATFYYYLNQSYDPDDNNVHYTNTSCIENNTNGYYTNWSCFYDVWYYANNGTWRINATVNDSYGAKDNKYRNATIAALLALNVTDVIDFGQLAVTETSPSAVQANVTNFGNRPINVSVYGFGGENPVLYAGLAMICEQRNITLPNERYSMDSVAYDSMTSLTGTPAQIAGLTIQQQTDDAQQVINATYWRLHVNLTTNPFGICNGTVVFSAEAP